VTEIEIPRGALVAMTGATGFLGSHVAAQLLASGYRVRAAIRATSNLRWVHGHPIDTVLVPLVPQSLTPPARMPPGPSRRTPATQQSPGTPPPVAMPTTPLEEAAHEADLDGFLSGVSAVIHCAGVVRAPDDDAYRLGNVETTRYLLDAARRQATCRVFILISSLAAAGPAPLDRPRREEDRCEPITAYGRSKLAAEKLVNEPDLPFRTAILRPPALYGPHDRAFLPLFRLAMGGWMFRLGGRLSGFSLVDGRDAAAGVLALLESDQAKGPYFIDDGHAYAWPDIAAALGQACRRRIRTIKIPLGLLRTVARLMGPGRAAQAPLLHPDRLADLGADGWVCSGEKLRRETGFVARRGLEMGFQETLDYYRHHDWLPQT
jgi:nucleoside-diphosphate-sugar epimerase